MNKRCFLDISTLARWTGPPTGMIRVEHQLWKAASAFADVTPVFYDPATKAFRKLTERWSDTVLGWHGAVDSWGTDYEIIRTGWRRFAPSRSPVMRALERRRLEARGHISATVLHHIQRAVLATKPHRYPFRTSDGDRISIVPRDLALGEPIALGSGDSILSPSSDWLHKDLETLAAQKSARGFRYAAVCYDIIPLLFPHFFPAADVAAFKAYWHGMFALADLVIVNSQAVHDDVVAYCGCRRLKPPRLAVVPLASTPAQSVAAGRLPPGLEENRFALFVSTIEPRKNHRLLLDVWRDLLARGVPQASRFKLVFVGRAGWAVDDILAMIADNAAWGGSLLHLEGVLDDTLEALYRGAAFCLYPSQYEGFGLPVIEAIARDIPIIVSNGGALREFADVGCSLSPSNGTAWTSLIQSWIAHPARRLRPSASAKGASWKQVGWEDVVQQMLAAARGV